jgi:transposase
MTPGKPKRRGHITKEGRRDLRGVMVEASWVAVWHILTEQQADTNAQAQAVARKLMNWITYHGVIPGQHRDRLLLLYQHLDELGLSEELEEIDYYGTT